MRKEFSGYYRPNQETLKKMWSECIFVLNTNVLLGLYRYPKEAREELLRALKQVSNRIWIPHQVALEYQKNRLSVIHEQLSKFDEVIELILEMKSGREKQINELRLRKRHSVINPDNFLSEIDKLVNEFQSNMESLKRDQPDTYADDIIRDEIDKLFEGKVGQPLTASQLNHLYVAPGTRILTRKAAQPLCIADFALPHSATRPESWIN